MASMSPSPPSLLIGTRAAGDGGGECQERGSGARRSGPIGLSSTARFLSKLPLIISPSLSNILHDRGLEFFSRKFAAEVLIVFCCDTVKQKFAQLLQLRAIHIPQTQLATNYLLAVFCLELHAIILRRSSAEGILKIDSIIRH